MNQHTISLKQDSGPNLAFVKASAHLVKQNLDRFAQCSTDQEHQDLLTELWSKNYRSTLNENEITFNSNSDLTMFCLRWGS